MITEIKKSTFGMDGKPYFEIQHAEVTVVEDVPHPLLHDEGEA